MKAKKFIEFAKAMIDDVQDTLEAKGADYTQEMIDDRLDNFKRQAAILNVDPRLIWAVYFHKHIDAVDTWVRTGKVNSEALGGRFVDIICYALLGAALAYDQSREERHSTGVGRDGEIDSSETVYPCGKTTGKKRTD